MSHRNHALSPWACFSPVKAVSTGIARAWLALCRAARCGPICDITRTMSRKSEHCSASADLTDNQDDLEDSRCRATLFLIALMAAGCLGATLSHPRQVAWPAEAGSGGVPRVRTGIDPNHARWFELGHLPGIGETLARRVVTFREQRLTIRGDGLPVFNRPNDLTEISGIGQKTIRRLRPFLRFPHSADAH